MAWQMPEEPFVDPACPSIETVIVPRTRDLGDGFEVRRALPSVRRRMVGPFIFFDQMGPAVFSAGKGLDVRPHPHIGLATVTYLFEGEILHRDSLGTVQSILPGAVNLMTAGKGIVHSERTPPELRGAGGRLYGIQSWVALPKHHEEIDPDFRHTSAGELPNVEDRGVKARIIVGSAFGARSPVRALSETIYVDFQLQPYAAVQLPSDVEERALFVAEGEIEIDGQRFARGALVVLQPRAEVVVHATGSSRVLLLGGEPMDGPRHIYWNFVSSSREQIEEAKAKWRARAFPPVPEEKDFIPLPDEAAPVAKYP